MQVLAPVMQASGRSLEIISKSLAHLNFAANTMNFVVQAFYFVGEFGDRLHKAVVDVSLRDLFRGVANEIFGA
ncbi:MAG: hypothetical protein HY244_04225 [Rhizobiales bacterium]|nr:hypothetical protein [Hyphomicrobiales bacterium]